MEDFNYNYLVTYRVTVPVRAVSRLGRRAADTIAHTAVAKGLLKVNPEDLDKVSVEFISCGMQCSPDDVCVDARNVFRDSEEKEVRDEN